MSVDTPIPADVAQAVNDHIENELRQITQYDNREALDESGIGDLHRMAARIYALGYGAGRRYQAALAEGERRRERERERRGPSLAEAIQQLS
ncbi:hypothetical protein [Brachybacterium massiliense]|uniref:hypothetical protein n=1 Tax=Brachybacterium massiliense TaxID=1755098 RepID=UPI000B3BB816|nr:hypothetical protein [Brachybacterium massiliense]